MLQPLATVDHMSLPPEGRGTIRALSRIGYELPAAIADLIDNSIDACATRVEVTFYRNDDAITAVTIADNGTGMDMASLKTGMQFAGRTDHKPTGLGTYGTGLKSASFSQAKTLSVLSRQNGNIVGGRWSAEAIGRDWRCEVLDPLDASIAFDKLCLRGKSPSCGTLVIWERLDRLVVGQHADALDEFLNTQLPRLEAHLGLTFHRFLESDDLSIAIIVRHEKRALALPRPVRPYNPFQYGESGVGGWPKTLKCEVPGLGMLSLTAHIWPGGSSSENFLLGGRRGIEFQGFYFFRNNRLIQPGGWNGTVKSNADPELMLARVGIELPSGGVDVNVQKSALQVTAAQAQSLLRASDGETQFSDYIKAARATHLAYRRSAASSVQNPAIPGQGMPVSVRRFARHAIAGSKPAEEIGFSWDDLPKKTIFRLDLTNMNIVLNRSYRHEILDGASASGTDAPMVKMLLFQLYKDEFWRLRTSKKHRRNIALTNAILYEIVRTRRGRND